MVAAHGILGGRLRRLAGTALRVLLRAGLVLLVILVLLGVSLTLPGVREGALRLGLRVANGVLPGVVTLEKAAWPHFNTLELGGLLWLTDDRVEGVAAGDTVAAVANLSVTLNLRGLRHGEIYAPRLAAGVQFLDVPLLVNLFPPAVDSLMAAPDSAASGDPFLREGSLAGIPSVAAGDFSLTVGRVRVSPDLTLRDGRLDGSLEARWGLNPKLDLEHSALTVVQTGDQPMTHTLDHLGLRVTSRPETVGVTLDSLNVIIGVVGPDSLHEDWRAAGPVQLELTGRGRWDDTSASAEVRGRCRLPGPAHFKSLLPPDFPLAEAGHLAGTLHLSAEVADFAAPNPTAQVDLDLSETDWVDEFLLRADLKDFAVQLDTLVVDAFNGRTGAGPLKLDLTGSGFRRDGAAAAQLSGDFRIPLPPLVQTFLPERFRPETLDHLGGRLQVEAAVDDLAHPNPTARVALDLRKTDWLDKFQLRAGVENFAVQLDTLVVDAFNGRTGAGPLKLAVTGSGFRRDGAAAAQLSGDFRIPLPPLVQTFLPERFRPEYLDHLGGRLQVEAALDDLAHPNPTARVDLDLRETQWLNELRLEARLADFQVHLDTLDVDLLGAWVQASGQVDSTRVDLDFNLGVRDSTLLVLAGVPDEGLLISRLEFSGRTRGPLLTPTFSLDLASSFRIPRFEAHDVQASLAGTWPQVSGELTANGPLNLAGTRLDSLRLNLRQAVIVLDSLSADLSLAVAGPQGRILMSGSAVGDTIFEARLDTLGMTLLNQTLATTGPASLRYGVAPLLVSVKDFEMTGSPGFFSLTGDWSDEGIDLVSKVDLFFSEALLQELSPNPLWSQDGGLDLALKSEVALTGTAGQPALTGQARASLLPHRKRPALHADLDFNLVHPEGNKPGGLGAEMAVSADDSLLLKGQFRWPGQADLATGTWRPDSTLGLSLDFPRQSLGLEFFNQVMPPDVALKGKLGFQFALETLGRAARADTVGLLDGKLTGLLVAKNVDVALPNQSRMVVNMDCALDGSPADPRLSGKVEVASGFLRIPQLPRNLLPAEGESLLWSVRPDSADTSANYMFRIPTEDLQGPLMAATTPPPMPDLDLQIVIPGRFNVTGYGLNAEFSGDVKVTRGVDPDGFPGPAVRGYLGVKEGRFNFMKRVFTIRRAKVDFRGEVPPNPALDLVLETTVNSYDITIEVAGRATEPEVFMRSNPELNQADIMAVLLFGQPANSLDSQQTGRMNEENDPAQQLRENLTAMAVVLGTSDLTNTMSKNLGVDMMEMGSTSKGDATLMVGKYITPRILVTYNQALEKAGSYFVTVDYSLTRLFKLVSTYGQGEEASGLELKWSRRY